MTKEELKLSATNFGFDGGTIADILQKYGEDVMSLAIEAARNGISVSLIMEILAKFGPKVLDFLVSLVVHRNMMLSAAGDIIPGPIVVADDSSFIDIIVQKYLPQIIEKYLPMIMEKYGPQIIQLIVDIVLKNLQK